MKEFRYNRETIRVALVTLEKANLIKREFWTVLDASGIKHTNVLYLKLLVDPQYVN